MTIRQHLKKSLPPLYYFMAVEEAKRQGKLHLLNVKRVPENGKPIQQFVRMFRRSYMGLDFWIEVLSQSFEKERKKKFGF